MPARYSRLSAPVSPLEVVLGYVGAAATKAVIVGLVTLATAALFVPFHVLHPIWMMAVIVLTTVMKSSHDVSDLRPVTMIIAETTSTP